MHAVQPSDVAPAGSGNHLSSHAYWIPEELVASAWLQHAPFAFHVLNASHPRVFVELGTHRGFSYFAFCEGILRSGMASRAIAVDTWQGDDHAGGYGEDIWEHVDRVNRSRYATFSSLLRKRFDEAALDVADASVDLLHIDGRHGYEDVREDFETWLPKLSDRAIVLFHDVAERRDGWGVYRFWDEIASRYPSFRFDHGHGLGVLVVGRDAPDLSVFTAADESAASAIRDDYARLGERVEYFAQLVAKANELEVLRANVHIDKGRIHQLESELASLRASTSWRSTAVLRKVSDALRRR